MFPNELPRLATVDSGESSLVQNIRRQVERKSEFIVLSDVPLSENTFKVTMYNGKVYTGTREEINNAIKCRTAFLMGQILFVRYNIVLFNCRGERLF
jgi:hypothetical protein